MLKNISINLKIEIYTDIFLFNCQLLTQMQHVI